MKYGLNYDENSLGVDIDFIKRVLSRFSWLIKLLRFNVYNDIYVDEKTPTMYVFNHGQGFWGIIDVIFILEYWYIHKGFTTPLYLISEPVIFKIPFLRVWALKAGLKNATRQNIELFLKNRASVALPPGGDGELLKPVWMKDNPVFTKSMYINGRMKLKTQEWYLDVALKHNIPIVPSCFSGTHEMTPILYTSFLIHKYSGMAHLRKEELLPGYPITLNHFINTGLFLLTPFSSSLIAWSIFIVAHIYIDFLYTYPIIFRKLYINFYSKIDIKNRDEYIASKTNQKKTLRREILNRINRDITASLKECDNKRDDIFFWLYNNVYKKSNTLQKVWKYIYNSLFKLYMKKYSNYNGEFSEYFIK